MPALARLLLALTLVVAIVDWIAVGLTTASRAGSRRQRHAQAVGYVAKPATMVLLALFLLALTAGGPQPRAQVWLFFMALVLSLAGDVFLMLPTDLFLPGVASFALAHVAYIVGILGFGHVESWSGPGLAWLVLVLAAIPLVRRLLGAIDDRAERASVAIYMVVIGVMVGAAWTLPWRSGVPLAAGVAGAIGASLFFTSDSIIGWRRFVRDFPTSAVLVIVTYHLGQIGLVLSLAR
ncbi:MAG: lysoplasmalogenase [Acidimicrobiia bacterium]|nr:lysoplasmalogenase [Acidimicrobiia bacterium]